MISFLNVQDTDISIDEICQQVFKLIFEMIYEKQIGSINKRDVEVIKYTELATKRIPFIKELLLLIDESNMSKDIWSLLKKCIRLVEYSDFSINYDILGLMKRVFSYSKSTQNIMDTFLQYQYLMAFKELNGIYILNVHQSKGREFDIVYVIDYESLCKDKNLLYVALSRVKEKLIVLDWVERK